MAQKCLDQCNLALIAGLHGDKAVIGFVPFFFDGVINLTDAAGLLVEDSRRLNISGCSILDFDNAGLILRRVTDSIVSGCIVRNDTGQPRL